MDNEELKKADFNRLIVFFLVGLALTLVYIGLAQAVAWGEAPFEKVQRLERSYEAHTIIIQKADETIAKQMKIKDEAERALKSLTIDLAATKTQVELEKESPDLSEVARLNEKAASYAKELGN